MTGSMCTGTQIPEPVRWREVLPYRTGTRWREVLPYRTGTSIPVPVRWREVLPYRTGTGIPVPVRWREVLPYRTGTGIPAGSATVPYRFAGGKCYRGIQIPVL
jgi:hypothetical protein